MCPIHMFETDMESRKSVYMYLYGCTVVLSPEVVYDLQQH